MLPGSKFGICASQTKSLLFYKKWVYDEREDKENKNILKFFKKV